MADAVTQVVVHSGDLPDPAEVDLIKAALAELAAAIREERWPVTMPLPESERLADVADQVSAAFDAVRGPEPDRV